MNPLPSQGFSLVEVIVSILILMIAISGLMTTYNYMSFQVERARWKRSALHIAQKEIEEFVADPAKSYQSSVQVPITSSYSRKSIVEIKKDSADQSIECKIRWADEKDASVKNDISSVSLKTIVEDNRKN